MLGRRRSSPSWIAMFSIATAVVSASAWISSSSAPLSCRRCAKYTPIAPTGSIVRIGTIARLFTKVGR
jgi:hypothetical protein